MNKSEQAIRDTQQHHLHDAWGKSHTPTCEREYIARDTKQRDAHGSAPRPHRIVHEIPRKHTINGYAFDA
jgi:hypothetical protein